MLIVSPSQQLKTGVKAIKALKSKEIDFVIENSNFKTNEKLALQKTFSLKNDNTPLANWS